MNPVKKWILLLCVFPLFLFGRNFQRAKILCKMKSPRLNEVSGMVMSWKNKDLFWVHNDSGDGPFVYGVSFKGELMTTIEVQGGRALDWEDISMGKYKNQEAIFVGDIGDNDRIRKSVQIYILPEPSGEDIKKKKILVKPLKVLDIQYPNGPRNAEALFVDPQGNLFVVEKRKSSFATIYRLLAKDFDQPKKIFQKFYTLDLKKIAGRRSLRGYQITGGELSKDGHHLLLRGYRWAAELRWPLSPKISSKRIYIPRQPQGEAICYIDGNTIAITSERRYQPIFILKRSHHESSK